MEWAKGGGRGGAGVVFPPTMLGMNRDDAGIMAVSDDVESKGLIEAAALRNARFSHAVMMRSRGGGGGGGGAVCDVEFDKQSQ